MAAVEGTGGLPEEVPCELRTELERLQRQIKELLNNYQVILKGQLGNVRLTIALQHGMILDKVHLACRTQFGDF